MSLGVIVTELVINALKHGLPDDREDGRVVVSYETDASNSKLVVSDNWWKPEGATPAKGSLGTTLVKALAQQLDARVDFRQWPGRHDREAA